MAKIDKQTKGKQASVDGFAHEHIVCGILMKKYQNVSLVDLPLSTYDIIIVFKDSSKKENIIRAQAKTATKSISFTGGVRGGIDRTYKSDVKKYKQSTTTSDVVIGIHPKGLDAFDLYFVPTCIIEILKQSSISIGKLEKLKNNFEILEHCKDKEFILKKFKEFGII